MHAAGPRRLVSRALRRRGERGASAVEFALVVPMLVMLLLGTVTAGLAYSDHLSLTSAVRESARLGAAIDYSSGTWADSVRTRVQQTYLGTGSAPSNDQVCVELLKWDGTGYSSVAAASPQGSSCGTVPTPPTTGTTVGSCVVRVWARKPATITLAVVPNLSFNIAAQSVSQYGRTVGACTA